MQDPFHRPAVVPAVFYKDPAAALEWLEKAFGFKRTMVITDKAGAVQHVEMKAGGGLMMMGPEWSTYTKSPASLEGKNTQTNHIMVQDVDGHCARARAAGAIVIMEPADQFYGDRVYSATDLEGHVWSFGETVKSVTREDAEKASGLKIEGWYDEAVK